MPPTPTTRIAIIGCSSMKLDHAAPARELYQGQLFKLAVAWAEAYGLTWYVVSAKHGIISPDDVIEPYDSEVPKRRDEVIAWSNSINWQAYCLPPKGLDKTLVLLCGAKYRQAFRDGINFSAPPRRFDCEEPLTGIGGIGYQKQWLKQNTPN